MKTPTPESFDFYGLHVDSVRSVRQPAPHIQVHASDASEMPSCPSCGHPELYFQGRKKLRLRDAPWNGKRVTVEVALRSRQCKSCKVQFVPTKPYQDGLHHYTPRLRQWVLDRADVKRLTLAVQTGVCERSINQILTGA